jgi:hypothetical protein
MPPGTPQEVGSFLTRVVANESPDVAIATQGLEPKADGAVRYTWRSSWRQGQRAPFVHPGNRVRPADFR